jgi:hypothetical protein
MQFVTDGGPFVLSKAAPLSLPVVPTTLPSNKKYLVLFQGTYTAVGNVTTDPVVTVDFKYDGGTYYTVTDTRRLRFDGNKAFLYFTYQLETTNILPASVEAVISLTSPDLAVAGTMSHVDFVVIEMALG